MQTFRGWAAGFPAPQVVGGDFNADPDQIDTSQGMAGAFLDSWSIVGAGSGYTAFAPSPWMHLDYLFSDVSGRAWPQSTQMLNSQGISDHFAARTTFSIAP
jgi:endonuclease/exonuclease/phosphatase family metal-dependent hydrolase